jgi:hypothetical protein
MAGSPGNPNFGTENNPGVTFTPDYQPNNMGRPVGVRNRSTVARKILDMLIRIPDETFEEMQRNFPDVAQQVTIEEYITMQQAVIATKETNAYKAIMDSAYGAPKQDSVVDLTSAGKPFNLKDLISFEGETAP